MIIDQTSKTKPIVDNTNKLIVKLNKNYIEKAIKPSKYNLNTQEIVPKVQCEHNDIAFEIY
jgi:hypothetical protein